MKKVLILSLMLAFIFVSVGMQATGTIRVGCKSFTEQLIVGNMVKELLDNRGYDVELRSGMGSSALWDGLKADAIDLYLEYTGTAWLTHMGKSFERESPEELEKKVRAEAKELGLEWLDAIPINNTYAIAVWRDWAEEHEIKSISNLASYVKEQNGKVGIATTYEFYSRPDGLVGLQKAYEFAFHPESVQAVSPGMTFPFLINREVESTVVFGTDPITQKYDWILLKDDQNFFPAYDLSPVVREEVIEKNPKLRDILSELVEAFPEDRTSARNKMKALNAEVDFEKRDPEEVAHEFLVEQGLIEG